MFVQEALYPLSHRLTLIHVFRMNKQIKNKFSMTRFQLIFPYLLELIYATETQFGSTSTIFLWNITKMCSLINNFKVVTGDMV